MKIINVVQIIKGVLSSIESFPIIDGYFTETVAVREAEKMFKALALENGGIEEELENYLDDGNWDNENGYEVIIYWSGININD